jgi:hypothetical protein
MPGDHVGHFLPIAGERGAQVRGHGQVPGLAVPAGQRVVGDLAQHVVGEPVAAAFGGQPVGRHAEYLPPHQFGQGRPHRGLVLAGDRDQRLGRERGAQHRGVGDQPPHARVQGIEPGGQQRVQAVGHGQLPDLAGQPVGSLDRLHDVAVDQRPDGLHREQRDALRLGGDLGPRRRGHAGNQRVHQRVHRRRVQWIQGQRAPVPAGAESWPGLAQLGAGEDQHVHRQVPGPVDQVVQEVQQPGVGMLGVLDQQHHRVLGRQPLEEQPPPGEQLLPGQRDPVVPRERDTEQTAQPHPHIAALSGVGYVPVQALFQLGRGGLGRVFLGDAQPLADDLGQRPERHPFPVGQAPAPVPPHLPHQAVGVLLELPAQPRLAHPGRPRHQHQPRHPPLRHRMKQVLDRAQLRVPAGQRRLQPVHPLAPAHPGQHPCRPPQVLRLGLALQRPLARVGEPDRAARQPLRRRIGQHLPRPGRGLHPRRGVHRVPGYHALIDRA